MRIQLSDHFTYPWLLRFVVSPVLMMVFTSLYSIIDGFFVSNFVGKQPFAAVNSDGHRYDWVYDWHRGERRGF